MVLLFVMQLSFALVICQSLQGFIQDDKADYDARLQLYGLYGSFFRALYTMYEITYSGGWPAVVRPVIEKVSPWYAVPFLLYVALVVFAVIRIVTALFLKARLWNTQSLQMFQVLQNGFGVQPPSCLKLASLPNGFFPVVLLFFPSFSSAAEQTCKIVSAHLSK
jgi:hypothetical protein